MNDKCQRNECNFRTHIDILNNGGTHCCKSCKLVGSHGPFCERILYVSTEASDILLNPIDLLVVVVSCKKHSHLWPKILDRHIENLVILCGGAEKTELVDNILYLKCSDSYEGLPEKMMSAIEFIVTNDRFASITHILKADDHDTDYTSKQIANIPIKFGNILRSRDFIGQKLWPGCDRKYFFGKVDKTSIWHNKQYKGPSVPLLDGGATYILSKKAMLYIYENKMEYMNHIMEDLMVALILHKYNIRPFQLNYGIKTWRG